MLKILDVGTSVYTAWNKGLSDREGKTGEMNWSEYSVEGVVNGETLRKTVEFFLDIQPPKVYLYDDPIYEELFRQTLLRSLFAVAARWGFDASAARAAWKTYYGDAVS